MLTFIDHTVEENIYIVVALIDFFCAVIILYSILKTLYYY